MSETTPLLSMRAIEKSFSGVPALAGASLDVAPGEVHALVGQNGAGKSTLIKILTGAYRKDGGEVRFEGRPIEFASPQAAQLGGISTIYQEINLIPYRSVAENVFLGREPRRLGFLAWDQMHAAATRLLHRFQIDVDVRRPLLDFSTAIQQMVAIARAVSFEARLVIMDEPTSSLDERETGVLFDVIRELKRDGVSVVLVSHRLDELYAVCDRVTVMRDGRTVLVAEMAGIGKLQLVAAMLGRDLAQVRAEGATAFHNPGHRGGAELLRAEHLAAGRRVRDASLSVRSGEIVGLAGLLGSGRSEVARAVFGADRADGGTIEVDGQPTSFAQPADAIAKGLGYSPEDRKVEGIIPDMSVRENLTLALLPRLARAGIVDEVRQREVVERLIRRLGVRCASPEQRIRELSGGNQQKVLLARWLCMSPRLLILDEPTRGIDVGGKAEIQILIKELADQGLGVLMISSEIEEIVEGCDRVFVLRDGRTVAELPRAELSELAVMTAMAHGDGGAELLDG
jgi:galactofuranose transport system ATP-binding protein